MAGFLALAVMCARPARVAHCCSTAGPVPTGDEREPVIVMGAGEGGLQIVTAMLKSGPVPPRRHPRRQPGSAEPAAQGRPCHGRPHGPARGRRIALGARTLVVAIPSASGELIRDLARRADEAGLHTLILPPVEELLGTGVGRVRHPSAHRGRPAGPPRAVARHRVGRRLPDRQAGAGHRCRRLDRLRAVPPDPPLRPGVAGHAGPRRVGAAGGAGLDRGPWAARQP